LKGSPTDEPRSFDMRLLSTRMVGEFADLTVLRSMSRSSPPLGNRSTLLDAGLPERSAGPIVPTPFSAAFSTRRCAARAERTANALPVRLGRHRYQSVYDFVKRE